MTRVQGMMGRWFLVAGLVMTLVQGGAHAQTSTELDDPFAIPGTATPVVINQTTPTPAAALDDPFSAIDASGQAPDNPFLATAAPTATPSSSPVANPFNFPAATMASTTGFGGGPPAVPAEVGEIRGLHVLSTSVGYQNLGQLNDLIRDVNDGGFTRVYFEIRTVLGVAYNSALEEPLPTISTNFSNPAREFRRQVGRTGGRVIAVVDLLPAYSAAVGSRPPSRNPLGRFPEYANVSLDGKVIAPDNRMHLDPGNPEVVRYLTAVIREIDENVAPDGYLFRGVAYPGSEWGYSKAAVDEFRAAVGGEGFPPPDDPTWCAWRRDRLTQLVKTLRNAVLSRRADVTFAVIVEASGPPPTSWDEWTKSKVYAESMQDWITWGREAVVSEIVFQAHERLSPDSQLRAWVPFAGTNSGNARTIFSLAGGLNVTEQFGRQLALVRSRGQGTILYHYADPIRDRARGFYSSLPNVFYKGRMGSFVEGRRIDGPAESREFNRLFNPPPAIVVATPKPVVQVDVMAGKTLVFATPSPIPTPTPEAKYVPSAVPRDITLRSGSKARVLVTEVTRTRLVIRRYESVENAAPLLGPPFAIDRASVQSIEPPL